MKAKMKNKIITLARNEKFYTRLLISYLVIAMVFIINEFTNKYDIPRVILAIFAYSGIGIYLIASILNAIGKQKDEILNNNKWSYIILSESGPVSSLLLVFFYFLSRFIAMWFNEENLIVVIIVGVIYFTIFLFTLIKGVAAINYYFSEKLNK